MYFFGIFISLLCFCVILLCQYVVRQALFMFASRIWPALAFGGIVLLLIALFLPFLWLSALFAAAAITFLYGAYLICKGQPGGRPPRPRC